MHRKEFGEKIPNMGYPDDGNGRFMNVLNHDQWLAINAAKRLSNNMFEHSFVAPMALATGMIYPTYVCASLLTTLIGRTLYIYGYLQPK